MNQPLEYSAKSRFVSIALFIIVITSVWIVPLSSSGISAGFMIGTKLVLSVLAILALLIIELDHSNMKRTRDDPTATLHKIVGRYSTLRIAPKGLSLKNLTMSVGLLSTLTYVVLYAFGIGFTTRLGTTPEELGVSQQTLVIHAAVFGISIPGSISAVLFLCFSVLFLTSRFMLLVYVGTKSSWPIKLRPIYSAANQLLWIVVGTPERRVRLFKLLTAFLGSLVMIAALGNLSVPDDWNIWPNIWMCIFFVPLIYSAVRYFTVLVTVAIIGLMGIASVIVGSYYDGVHQASNIIGGKYPSAVIGELGYTANVVTPIWPTNMRLPLKARTIVFLGASGQMQVYTDGHQLLRVFTDGMFTTEDFNS